MPFSSEDNLQDKEHHLRSAALPISESEHFDPFIQFLDEDQEFKITGESRPQSHSRAALKATMPHEYGDMEMGESDAPMPSQNTPETAGQGSNARKRRYRPSMESGSFEASYNELSHLMKVDGMSPSTKGVYQILTHDFEMLGNLGRHSAAYYIKQAEILRSEMLLSEMIDKDQKFAELQASKDDFTDKSRILSLGDYHKTNLHIFKSTASTFVSESNKGRKGANRKKNLIGNRKWRDIIKQLDEEKWALKTWCSHKSGERPKQELTDFITAVGNRCRPRTWTFRQAYFEITEYQKRNSVAHIGIDEWIDDASNEHDPHTREKMWTAEPAICETLEIFEKYHFDILDRELDNDGVKTVKAFEVAPDFLPIEVYDDPQINVKQRIIAFVPINDFEEGLQKNYLIADRQVLTLTEDIEHGRVALEGKKGDKKKWEHHLGLAVNAFQKYEKWLKNNPHSQKEIAEGLEHLALT
ncbi:hypothetical protein BGZ57DRAFT_956732 [Hyaloscypha finlandica]|nr:hypothetical protein BGZ57DRAFT_956732 [Hyaloscypha finlandica]